MKKRKNILLLAGLLALVLLVSACGTAQTTSEQTETETSAVETSAEETTPAPTEPPTRTPSEVKVGMIFYGEENDGSVLAASLRSELTEAAAGMGIGEDQILWQYNSREADWTEIEDSILACVDAGCQIIFGGAREYESVIAAIAEEYPEVMFACVNSDWMNGKNSGTFQISLAAAQYLCGVAAGTVNTTGHIGFLAAKDDSDEEVTAAVNAFAYGVWSVNPDAVVEMGVTGKWFLPEAEIQGISELQALDCDVIGGYTDSSAGLAAAMDAGLYVTGCGAADGNLYGPAYETQTVGAALYRWREYFSMKLNQVIQKEICGEAWSGDCYSGAALFAERETAVIPDWAWEQLEAWGPMEETGEPEEIPVISMDEETGYLENIRIHFIEVKEAEEEQ